MIIQKGAICPMPQRLTPITTRQHMAGRPYEVHRSREAYYNEWTLHHHDFYEVYLCLSGSMDYIVDNRIYHVTTGDILIISPNELHQPMFGDRAINFDRIVLWVDRAYLERTINFGPALNRCFERASSQQSNLLRTDSSAMQLMQALLENINTELEKRQFAYELTADTCLIQFMILLNRLEEKGGQSLEMLDRSGSVVGKVLAYINEHYREDLSLDMLANQFFISKYHLSREFNRLVGTSVYRYITQKRLVVAKQMLTEGVPSSEAFQHCGFGDYSSFYRAFRSEYQISPKEFVSKLKQATAMAQARAERMGMPMRPEENS